MCAAADGAWCARVCVLPSLLKTSKEGLFTKLSGLLKRPVFVFPFQRDLDVTQDMLKALLNQLDMCKQQRGVVLSTPDQRLSFLLKWKQMMLAKDGNILGFEKVLKWWDENMLDILDESDEQLRHKFQLLYPIGIAILELNFLKIT